MSQHVEHLPSGICELSIEMRRSIDNITLSYIPQITYLRNVFIYWRQNKRSYSSYKCKSDTNVLYGRYKVKSTSMVTFFSLSVVSMASIMFFSIYRWKILNRKKNTITAQLKSLLIWVINHFVSYRYRKKTLS